MISMLIENMVEDLRCEIVGSASTLDDALRLARQTDADLAILDVRLKGAERSDTVAETLRQRGIPFIFVTGYGAGGIPEQYESVPTLPKPFQARDLKQAIDLALAPPDQGGSNRHDDADGPSR